MSTHGVLCFTNIEKEEILNSPNMGKKLKDEVKIFKHSDGYDIGTFLSDFLKDEALRRDYPEYLTSWALYELMASNPYLSYYENDKRQFCLSTHDDYLSMDYVFIVVNGKEVLLYKYGEFKGIFTLNNLEELKNVVEELKNQEFIE